MTTTLHRALYLPSPGKPASAAEVGGKAHHLARLQGLDLRVPAWFVVLPETGLDDDARSEILSALERMGLGDRLLAVRSSATVEDAESASFAGQFRSVLGVSRDGLWDAIRRVRESVDSAHVLAYRKRHPELAEPRMAVIIQEMVDATVSGVLFTRDPVAREGMVVSAIPGCGERLVSGEVDGETYRVEANGRIEHGGTSLSAAELRVLGEVGRRIESAFGAPQDVEWALDRNRRLYILQTRAITTLGVKASGEGRGAPGERRLWDNSNIVESYGGVTTPLTFSFARAAYEQAYLQLCRVLGVEERLLRDHRDVFAHMLGFIRSRVYYNLLNWYRALALLPGYSFNRAFMERMMGVREKLAHPPETPYATGRVRDLWRLTRMAGRLLREQHRLPAEIRRFHARVDAALLPLAGETLEERSADDLAALYRRLERELLEQWRTPLVNDFLAMIYFGILARMVEKWLPEAPPTLMNDLLIGEGGIVSTQPAERLHALAVWMSEDPPLVKAFAELPDDRTLWVEIGSRYPEFHAAVLGYVERFGDRTAGELKLETVTPRQEPWRVLGLVRSTTPIEIRTRGEALRARAEGLASAALGGWRLTAFRAVLRRTRERVRDRENLRFERTRVFGLTRRIFLAIGGRLAQQGCLSGARDIFFLTREEVLGTVEGSYPSGDLRSLVTLRRAEFGRHEAEPGLPDRFETFGPPEAYPLPAPTPHSGGGELRGTGCCPGVVRGRVKVVTDPAEAGDLRGSILVAERTDPGWTLLFPAAAGLLVQRGSLLSHSAIVAREVGLPCIVSIPNLMDSLKDGEWVEMDGAAGVVRRVTP